MVCEKTKLALQKLFPPPEPEVPEPVQDSEGEETDNKADKKVQPRSNGIVERDYKVHGYHLDIQIDPNQLLSAVQVLDDAEFFLETITGVDWIKAGQMEVIYDFSRYDFDVCRVVIRTRVDRTKPEVPTITNIYAGANWHERETHEFFGIKFTGHPYLVPLLLPEDADFHPLRKDFKA